MTPQKALSQTGGCELLDCSSRMELRNGILECNLLKAKYLGFLLIPQTHACMHAIEHNVEVISKHESQVCCIMLTTHYNLRIRNFCDTHC